MLTVVNIYELWMLFVIHAQAFRNMIIVISPDQQWHRISHISCTLLYHNTNIISSELYLCKYTCLILFINGAGLCFVCSVLFLTTPSKNEMFNRDWSSWASTSWSLCHGGTHAWLLQVYVMYKISVNRFDAFLAKHFSDCDSVTCPRKW